MDLIIGRYVIGIGKFGLVTIKVIFIVLKLSIIRHTLSPSIVGNV